MSVGSYKVIGFLGEGGQGSVYLGTSPTGERVAIKLLHARFADDEQAVRRFRREAEAARRVAEFCTARVLEVGAVNDQPYIVGEYVDGPSLQRQVSGEGPLRDQALVRLAIATATALAAIHRAGVMHRDFKPSNVLLAPDGPRVIDFGIARALDVSQSLTTSVVGTPAYMAPEQFHGEPSPASDVFAWAGTMVYAATGHSAFGFGALPVVMHRILSMDPDLSGVPEPLRALLWTALGKDPRRRPTAEQVLGELIRSSAPPPPVAAYPQTAPPGSAHPQPPAPGSVYPQPSAPGAVYPQAGSPAGPRWESGPQAPSPYRRPSGTDPGGVTPVTAPGARRRGVLVSVAAVATALMVGLGVWLIPRVISLTGPGVGPTDPATTAPTGFDAAVTAVANPSTKTGGTLRLTSAYSLDSTDPGNTYYPDVMNAIRLYGRSLTMFKPVPGKAGTELVPDLAESLGQANDGGRTWTYRLRNGVKFQDGTPVTSADVKYAVLRSMDDAFDNGPTYFDTMLDLPTGYEGPYKSPNANTDSAIQTPDDRTIVFHLKKPYGAFDTIVQLPETVPVPRAKDTHDKYRYAVTSSGPYMFDSATDTKIVLVRNPSWDPATDPNRKALPDRYELQYELPAADARTKLLNGDSEVGSPIADLDSANVYGSPAVKNRADAPVGTKIHYLAINPQVPPFDKVDCRRAVIRALDLTTINLAFVGGLNQGGQIPNSLVPPLIPGTHALLPDLTPSGDGDAAKESLNACGKPGGFTTTYIYRDTFGESAAAQAVQASLAKVGIKIQIRGFPLVDFHAKYGGNPEYLKQANVGLIARAWVPDWPDVESFVTPLADSREILEKGHSINVNVRLSALDALIDTARQEPDATTRAQRWSEVEQKLADEALLVPLSWDRTLLVRGKKATNVWVNPVYAGYDLLTMGVS
ncbi:ABC transporter substrate-binding protein [Nonomuraea sp. NEAU-A123]|uniref:ABC transporter substrate-binding protein n=1 Tax=Nonomuraea sp. NEAU-A123 TaxID=2839649 RepID=UPI001BE402F5|nr:ABC transporter substrate-binding protein [Nonomuraea sp. NEAU-A123]MBT2226782.1 protein kinase [Nonomuraea sp. NEAU-A123]